MQVAGLETGIGKTGQAIVQVQADIKQLQATNDEKQCQLKSLNSQIEKAEQRVQLNAELVTNTQATVKDIDALIQVIQHNTTQFVH